MVERTVRVNLTASNQAYNRTMQQSGLVTQQTSRQMSGMKGQAGGLLGTLTRFGPALLAGGGAVRGLQAMGSASVAFEESAIKLRSQIGLTTAEMDELSAAAREVGVATGIGAQEAVDASFFIASAGLRGADAMDALEISAQGARVGLGETATVADLVTSAMNAYGSDTLDAAQAMDVLIGTVKEGKAEAPQLAASLGSVLPVASEMGVTFEDVGASVAAMTRTGTDAQTATRQLRQIMLTLQRPSQDTADALDSVGLSAEGLRDMIREDGLWAALTELREATDGQDDVLARVFNNTIAYSGAVDLLGSNIEANAQVFDNMTDTVGNLDEAIEASETTNRDRLNRMKANFQDFGLEAGDAIMELLAGPIDGLNTAFDGIDTMNSMTASGLLSDMDALRAAAGLSFGDGSLGDLVGQVDQFEQMEQRRADLRGEADRYVETLSNMAGGQREADDSAEGLNDALGDVEVGAEDAATSVERLEDAIGALIRVNLTAESAAIRVEGGFADLTDTLKENGATLDRTTEKGRENERAIIDQAGAILDEVEARARQGDSLATVMSIYDDHVAQLREVLAQAGLTEDEIESYIATLGLTPEEIRTALFADNFAAQTIEDYIRRLGDIPRNITTQLRAQARVGGSLSGDQSGLRSHNGGMAGQGWRRYHNGGLAGDEIPTILQRGELITSRRDVAAAGGPVAASALLQGRYSAPSAGGGAHTVHVSMPVMLDGRQIGTSDALIDALSGEVRSRSLQTAGAGPW